MAVQSKEWPGLWYFFRNDKEAWTWYDSKPIQPAGKNGTSRLDCDSDTPKKVVAYNTAKTFINYAYYAREYLANEFQDSNLEGFLKYLNNDTSLSTLYNLDALIFEFQSIEHHYFKLRTKISFIPFYESLKGHIVIYENLLKNQTGNKEDLQEAIRWLKAAVQSRIIASESKENNEFVKSSDISESFLNAITPSLETLTGNEIIYLLRQRRDESKNELDIKINDAIEMVKNIVLPLIDENINEIYDLIDDLLEELSTMENLAEIEKGKAKINEETMKHKLILHAMLAPLKLGQTVLTFFGPPGMIASAIGGAVLMGVEALVDITSPEHKFTVSENVLIKKEVDRISNEAQHNYEELVRELDTLFKVLQIEHTVESEPIQNDMRELNVTIKDVMETNQNINITRLKQVDGACDQLMKGLQNLTKHLQERDRPNTSLIKGLTRMSSFLKLGQAGLKIFEKVCNDDQKLKETSRIIEQIDQKLGTIRKHRMNIYYEMIPKLQFMSQSADFFTDNLDGKSHTELIIARMSIQNLLANVNKQFDKMSRGLLVNENIKNCVDKIRSGITAVIDVYKEIDSYKGDKKMAEYIADIAAITNGDFKNDFSDQDLKRAIGIMKMKINLNLVMEQYERAMFILIQHKFPFAKVYNNDSSDVFLYSNLTDMKLINKIRDKMESLESQLKRERIQGTSYQSHLTDRFQFNDSFAFYKWDYGEYKNDITNLLKGKPILLNADIKKNDLDCNAIKFRDTWIRIVLKNPSKQKEFDDVFRNFAVHMKMVGNDYYHCNKRIYYFFFENTFEFKFQMEDGRPINQDDETVRLKSGEPFLSPYTTWEIVLEPLLKKNTNFDRLEPFANEISQILLEGNGQYLDNDEEILEMYCKEDLDQYYHFDELKIA